MKLLCEVFLHQSLSTPCLNVLRGAAGATLTDWQGRELLDFHGNGSSTSNKVGVLPATAKEDNNWRAFELQWLANQRLQRRYVLHQQDEKACSPYLLDRVYIGGQTPFLMNTAARDRYGLLVELTAGYADSYGTVLQTEVTCTICWALFRAFPAP